MGIAADSLWYHARLTRERARANRWRAAAAVAIVTAVAAMVWRPKSPAVTIDRPVIVRAQPETPFAAPLVAPVAEAGRAEPDAGASMAYLRLRDSLSLNGLDSLPATASGDTSDAMVPHAGPVTREAFERLANSNHTFIRGG
jgi:hypothetical protein